MTQLNDSSLNKTISLIKDETSTKEVIEQCFYQLGKMFDCGDDMLKDNIFNKVYLIKGFESEKYKLLIEHFLSESPKYYKGLNMFFINFSDPDYFFEIYVNVLKIFYSQQEILNTEPFYSSFNHFWNKSRIKTESRLFMLLTHDNPYLRIGAVKLIRYSYEGISKSIDLLKLDTERKQLRALEVLIRETYFNISDILPLILQFKQSPYPNVITYLEKKLRELVFESYQDYLYNLLEETIGEDVDFMKSIKEALDEYKSIQKEKNKDNDLNPRENERDWMQLYYRLDGERQKQMMEEASGGSFLALHIKKSIIVRGKSWKVGEKNEISPLGHFEHMFTVDSRIYKDSDLFDAQYAEYNFQSEF